MQKQELNSHMSLIRNPGRRDKGRLRAGRYRVHFDRGWGGCPFNASLLPEIHIAILKSSDILPSLPDAMHLVKNTSAAVFITGPSRTADIEMTLTIGVHGPKEIHVFLT